MSNRAYSAYRLSTLIQTGIFEYSARKLISHSQEDESNPLKRNETLRTHLMQLADSREVPAIYKDSCEVYFGCLNLGDSYLLFGPMSLKQLNRIELHQFYASYGIDAKYEKPVTRYTITELLNTIGLLANIYLHKEVQDEELIHGNDLIEDGRDGTEAEERLISGMKTEEAEMLHHTYIEECKLLDCIKEGKVEEAVQHTKDLDMYLGRLSHKELNHWKNAAVAGITLCTRAAIEGGILPSSAYQISDYYICKIDECRDIIKIISLRTNAVVELADQVKKKLQTRAAYNYIEQCKYYVEQHYREKIYLDDIAKKMGIGSTYLSKLFSQEAGMRLQDYIIEVRIKRAANMLRYSEETIARIAEYVNLPSQSYFGMLFKRIMGETPTEYRKKYKTIEFIRKS